MGADIRMMVKFSQIDSNIFDRVKPGEGSKVIFTKDTKECTFTMSVDLDDILGGILTKTDFEIIEYSRSTIERAERAEDFDKVAELKRELVEDFSEEYLEAFDQVDGDYNAYKIALAEKIILDINEYEVDDNNVLVEVWL